MTWDSLEMQHSINNLSTIVLDNIILEYQNLFLILLNNYLIIARE